MISFRYYIIYLYLHIHFEITYLNLSYDRCPTWGLQWHTHLGTKITDLFMSDINDNNNWYSSFLTLKIQVLYSIFLRLAFKNVYIHNSSLFSKLKFYQHCEFFGISQLSKSLMFLSIFPFCSIYQLFCHIFFKSLFVSKPSHRHNKQK